jgi:hypothetical protein
MPRKPKSKALSQDFILDDSDNDKGDEAYSGGSELVFFSIY